jgi:hypothetical protein
LRRSILLVVGAAGVAGCLCILFLCMRSVMEIGGVCASGNTPYAINHPCPSGVPGLMTGSILLGLVFLGVYALSTFSLNLVLLAWPALFLSLGWNFFDYGINPPGDGGVAGGWILCGVIFVLMGGVPLVIGIMALLKGRETRWRTPDQDRLRERLRLGSAPAVDLEERERSRRNLSIVLHLVGIAAGLWGGIELFEWVTGSHVSIGFR